MCFPSLQCHLEFSLPGEHNTSPAIHVSKTSNGCVDTYYEPRVWFFLRKTNTVHTADKPLKWKEYNTRSSRHARESEFQNLGNFCSWNPESRALESKIQLKESGVPLLTGIRNPNFTNNESGIHGVESRIQDCLGFTYTGPRKPVSVKRGPDICGWRMRMGKCGWKKMRITKK